jgi:DNA-binding CsgD family transcriptional regulator
MGKHKSIPEATRERASLKAEADAERMRKAVRLRAEGLTSPEIGERLGMSPGGVLNLLMRARRAAHAA